MHTRLFLLLAGLGLFAGCGKDEQVAPLFDDGESDAGDETQTSVSPTTVSPTSASVSPTVTPVNPGPATSKLAATCASDAECGTGMKCLTSSGSDLFSGGASNGFCTMDCAADPNVCTTVQSGAICITAGEVSYCFPDCQPGGTSATKCQGRSDVACDYVTLSDSALSFCRPMCRSDEDCGGRKCRLGNGICVDELPGAGEIGASCDPTIQPSTECRSGSCVAGVTEGTASTGTCSGLCSLGTNGCNVEGESKGGDAWCAPFQSGSTTGDIGICSQICDCDDQCSHDSFRCLTFSETAVATYGINGICAEFDSSTEDLAEGFALGKQCEARDDAGSDGGADAAGDAANDATVDAAQDAMSVVVDASKLEDSGDAQSDAD